MCFAKTRFRDSRSRNVDIPNGIQWFFESLRRKVPESETKNTVCRLRFLHYLQESRDSAVQSWFYAKTVYIYAILLLFRHRFWNFPGIGDEKYIKMAHIYTVFVENQVFDDRVATFCKIGKKRQCTEGFLDVGISEYFKYFYGSGTLKTPSGSNCFFTISKKVATRSSNIVNNA